MSRGMHLPGPKARNGFMQAPVTDMPINVAAVYAKERMRGDMTRTNELSRRRTTSTYRTKRIKKVKKASVKMPRG